MLIDYKAALALKCPICGELELHHFTIFDFSGRESFEIECGCGFTKMLIEHNDYKQYWLQFACVICEVEHVVNYSAQDFWSAEVKEIFCLENEIQLGHLGPAPEIEDLLGQEDYLDLVFDEIGFENYFSSPEIMLSAINLLHDIAQKNGLSCQCGNGNIEIDMFSGKIELFCDNCDGLTTINAETEDDLSFLKKIKKIEMLEGVVSALEKKN